MVCTGLRWVVARPGVVPSPLWRCCGRVAGTTLGSEFLPELDEGSIWVNVILPPSVSPSEAQLIARRIRQKLRTVPEVARS